MEFKDRFSQLLEAREISVYRAAKDTGINQQSLTDYKKGVSEPKQDKLITLAEYFDISETWLRTGLGDPYIKGKDHQTEQFIKSLEEKSNSYNTARRIIEIDEEAELDFIIDRMREKHKSKNEDGSIKTPKRTERPPSKEDRLLVMNESQQQTIKSLAETVAAQQRTIESLEKRLK